MVIKVENLLKINTRLLDKYSLFYYYFINKQP